MSYREDAEAVQRRLEAENAELRKALDTVSASARRDQRISTALNGVQDAIRDAFHPAALLHPVAVAGAVMLTLAWIIPTAAQTLFPDTRVFPWLCPAFVLLPGHCVVRFTKTTTPQRVFLVVVGLAAVVASSFFFLKSHA